MIAISDSVISIALIFLYRIFFFVSIPFAKKKHSTYTCGLILSMDFKTDKKKEDASFLSVLCAIL